MLKYIVVCFFFFKQKTAYELRISDWSSDVCSSDLVLVVAVIDDPGDLGVDQTSGLVAVGFRCAKGSGTDPIVLARRKLDHAQRLAHAPAGDHLAGNGRRLLYVAFGAGGAGAVDDFLRGATARSEEHTSELQSLMRISYA